MRSTDLAQSDLPPERKFLTVLCADICASTELIAELDPEDAMARLAPTLEAMRIAVHEHGGIVSEELGDGVLALFGAPKADEHHATRACLAALSTIHRVQQLNDRAVQVRIGIHSGYAVTRYKGSDLSRIYGASGPTVHMASRLQSAAEPGAIVVSAACHDLATDYISSRSIAPLRLKGFLEQVPAYLVTGIANLSRWQVRELRPLIPFVDREQGTEVLRRNAELARAGQGQVIALIGEPGIGKSRFIHEGAARLQRSGWSLIEAECDPAVDPVPYSLLRKIFGTTISQSRAASQPTLVAAETLSTEARRLHDCAVATILNETITEPAWRELGPAMRRKIVSDVARCAIEQAVGERPVLMLIEDCHWADEESGAILSSLDQTLRRCPLLMVLSSRPEAEPVWLTRLASGIIRLAPLEPQFTRDLLDRMLGDGQTLEPIKAKALNHAGGVPLFIEEVIRQMVDTGSLVGKAGSYVLGSASEEELSLPATVHGVLASRIDRLAPETKQLLQVAAVAGRRISVSLLGEITGLPARTVTDHLLQIEEAHLLVPSAPLPELVYEFAHDLLRVVTYESILKEMRVEYHRRALAALEARVGDQSDEQMEALCEHATASMDWPKAEHYASLIARKAMGRSIFRHAARYYGRSIAAIDHGQPSRDREVRVIDMVIEARAAFMPLGLFTDWLKLAQDAERRAATIADRHREVAAAVSRAGAMNFANAPAEAIEAGEAALLKATELGDTAYLNAAENALGQAYYTVGRYRDAERLLEDTCARLARPDAEVPPWNTVTGLRVLCLMMKSAAHAWLGEFRQAEATQLEAERAAQATGRAYDMAAASYAGGVMDVFAGRADRAIARLEPALEHCRQYELYSFAPVIAYQLGQAHLQRGNAEKARESLQRALDGAVAIRHTTTRTAASVHLALARLQLGERQPALELAVAARDTARQHGNRGIEVQALMALALARAAGGAADWPEAESTFEAGIALASELGTRPALTAMRHAYAQALGARGLTARAREQLELAEDPHDGPGR